MAFADDFAACMTDAGIAVDPSVVPDPQSLQAVVDYVNQQLGELDSDLQSGVDEVTTSEDTAQHLADSEVGIVDPAYVGLLQAFDNAKGYPLSLCLQWAAHCIQQASAGQN